MNTKKSLEFYVKKNELAEKIFEQISPLLEGLNYSQAFIVLDAVREKISGSIYFIPPQTPEAKCRSLV